MWLKTENFSNACGTTTLKSPPSRVFSAPHVHPRLRKRLARCTLDCGLESVKKPRTAGLCGRAAGACDCGPLSCAKIERPSPSNKSGLKSSAFHPKSFPRISPKSYRHKFCLKSFFIPFFNLSHKWPTFAFTPKAGTHSAFGERSHTTAHTAKHGAFRMEGGITTLGPFRTFTNIPGPGIRTASFAAFGAWSWVLPKNAESLRNSDALMRVAVPRRRGPAGLRDLFATW